MALISEPRVLFLDEPTLGLDPRSRRGMGEHIAALKRKTTILLTTHYLDEADALADRIAIVDQGRIVAIGTPAELKNQIAGGSVTVVEAADLTEAAIAELREKYPEIRRIDGGIEIEADDVSVYDLEDVLRPRGIAIEPTYRKRVTLDDVFLTLTGKQLRE